MPNIKSWCRWQSTETARGYAECPEEGTIKLVTDRPRAPNLISKDIYAHNSSKLEVRDVWPARLFKSEVLNDTPWRPYLAVLNVSSFTWVPPQEQVVH